MSNSQSIYHTQKEEEMERRRSKEREERREREREKKKKRKQKKREQIKDWIPLSDTYINCVVLECVVCTRFVNRDACRCTGVIRHLSCAQSDSYLVHFVVRYLCVVASRYLYSIR